MAIEVNDKNLGSVTAYAYAKKNGYTGTEQQFSQLMASYATVAENAASSASAAASSAATATAAEQSVATTIATTGAAQIAAIETKGEEVIASIPSDYTELSEDVDELDEAVAKKANVDGSYDTLTAGNAEQLISTQVVEDKVPYLFRTSGGSADIGNRENDMIVGGSIVWNQLAEPINKEAGVIYGLTMAIVDNVITISGTPNQAAGQARLGVVNNKLFNGHVVLFSGRTSNFFFRLQGETIYSTKTNGYFIRKVDSDNWVTDVVIGMENMDTTASYNETATLQLFDLTRMFGSTIADYILSLENATAGAGIAWFKRLFPKDYYAYNAGTMMHVSGLSAHKMIGFNQWDENITHQKYWDGSIGSVPYMTSHNERCCSTNPIKVLPNTTYYCKNAVNVNIAFCDADGKLLSRTGWIKDSTFTTPTNADSILFTVASDSYKTGDICINLSQSGTRNGEYEPYKKNSYPLDDSLTLCGNPKLDASNNLYYDGDTYEPDGTVTRRYGIVDLGTLSWQYDSTNARFCVNGINAKRVSTASSPFICTKYVYVTGATNGGGQITPSTSPYELYIYDSAYTDAATFKTAVSGVMLVYELATPTTETAEPYQDPQVVDDWGTEEYVSTSLVPVGHDTKYPANLRDKLQHLPDLASSDGLYAVRQTGSDMSLEALVIEDTTARSGVSTLNTQVSSLSSSVTTLQSDVDAAEADIDAIEADVSEIKSDLQEQIDTLVNIIDGQETIDNFTLIDGYANKNTGGLSTYSENGKYKRTDYIAIPKVAKIEIDSNFTSNAEAGYAFYTSAKVFISGGASYPASVPPNAAYVIFSDYSSSATHTGLVATFIYRSLVNKIIACYGDSITEGMGMTDIGTAVYGGDCYPSHLLTMLTDANINARVFNYGHSGERSTEICARVGGRICGYLGEDVTIPSNNAAQSLGVAIVTNYKVTGSKIYSTGKNADGSTAQLLFTKLDHDTRPLMVGDRLCNIDKASQDGGTIQTINLATAAGEDVTIPALSVLTTGNSKRNADVAIVYMGVNDGTNLTLDEWIDRCNSIIERNPKTLILGATNQNWTFWTGMTGTNAEKRATYLNACLANFGSYYLDLYDILTTKRGIDIALAGGYLSDRTAEQISADNTAIANRQTPPSLTIDGTAGEVHLNSIGYYVLAKVVYDKINQLGLL